MSQNKIPVTDVSSQGHGGCGCGCSASPAELPRLDARPFPPKLRHAAIFSYELVYEGDDGAIVAIRRTA